jgi:alkanesulfonate monooxygenase SsuD/methylene tetrahydromethanopterin reductase-like flavin-dependent oxidoreductase (luciferase family)
MGPSGAVLGPPPEPGSMRLLIGPSTPKAAMRAHLADGVLTFFWEKGTEPQKALNDVACRSWVDHGRAGRPRWVAGLFFAVGPDARARAEVTLRAYYESFGETMDEVMAMLSVIETTSDAAVADAIARFADSGADELILCPLIPDLEQIDRLRDLW